MYFKLYEIRDVSVSVVLHINVRAYCIKNNMRSIMRKCEFQNDKCIKPQLWGRLWLIGGRVGHPPTQRSIPSFTSQHADVVMGKTLIPKSALPAVCG